MKAAVWAGINRIEVRDVPELEIVDSRDIIVKVSRAKAGTIGQLRQNRSQTLNVTTI